MQPLDVTNAEPGTGTTSVMARHPQPAARKVIPCLAERDALAPTRALPMASRESAHGSIAPSMRSGFGLNELLALAVCGPL